MRLDELITFQQNGSSWILWNGRDFESVHKYPTQKKANRETLARFYQACTERMQQKIGANYELASRLLRQLWTEVADQKSTKSLPKIIAEDGFLCMYALGLPCSLFFVQILLKKLEETSLTQKCAEEPIYMGWNELPVPFFDVDATPPGLLPKISRYFRLKTDRQLLKRISSDLAEISKVPDPLKREFLTLAILSHGAAYRELNGCSIEIPSFKEQGKLVTYTCHQHLIEVGLKTISLIPNDPQATPIYLCEGTEFWPSQPSMLGSIIANFGEHGSATEAYAHSWRRIHKQLRDFGSPPLVAGHSMGGALAMQIGLYSHSLIEKSYAFNPPVPNVRDYAFYHQMSEKTKEKVQVFANLDDFAFWRIGSHIIGHVTLFLGKTRWKYFTVDIWDCIWLLPAFFKFIKNVHHAFPAHQRIAALGENWVSVKLTQEEIERENQERVGRFDYLHFLPKLYDPMKVLLTHIRKIFRWRLEEEFLRNEIEILSLHERDLIDTLSESNREETERTLKLLQGQKNALLELLIKRQMHR